MELLVFGASGRVGRRLCEYAVSGGHRVTAFVRDADRAPRDVAVVEGDVTDPESVAAAIDGQDAVCSALGPDGDDLAVLGAGIDNLVAAMGAGGVERLVAVAAAGILQATPGRLRLETDGFRAGLRPLAAAHRTVYDRLRPSELDWTLVCPPRMPDGPPTNHYRTAVDYLPDGGQSVSSGDVATLVYDAAVNGSHGCERVGIAY
ncbi:NAD(P)-dependent oxidoreductase [Haloarcula onubensis]|uniref:NAD(P)H-binding protein n=1 Tax=Haloarcula onubensis TaxID=2950539 RepID=A0ABU2FRQ7_9EURY|nr:NAD(P)H-binding protein [Halomicroarcula sp. S3CR25-11]MDS0283454.1 NAD(P)H-binding protein [Halomicroarcula sp. S3CR25-11]